MSNPRGPQPQVITITEKQGEYLEQIIRRANSPQSLVKRAQIILKASAGARNQSIADELGLHVETVRLWRRRWSESSVTLKQIEEEEHEEKIVRAAIERTLKDKQRSGTPAKFSAEQVCHIVAVSCEAPEISERAVSHWTPTELAAEVIKRGIVESISARQIGRFLK